jgi:lysine 6-dehydrogenase
MTGLETLTFDGIGEFEAFYTSGGISTLPDTLGDRIGFLDYKTIRYPGHCRLMRAMLEIGLASRKPIELDGYPVEPRALFQKVLSRHLGHHDPDMILVRVTVVGETASQPKTITYEIVDRQEPRSDLTAMMRCTAFPAAIMARMIVSGEITRRGVQPQELAVKPTAFFPELKKRGIRLQVTES